MARKKGNTKPPVQVVVIPKANPKGKNRKKKTKGQNLSTRIVTRGSTPEAEFSQIEYLGPRMSTYGDISPAKNSGSLIRVTSAATAGTEVSGTVLFNVRNATELPWLSGQGVRYSKYRVKYAHFTWEPIVGTSTVGEICMAMLYDTADTSNLTIERLMQTKGSIWGPIHKPSKKPMCYDASRASVPWYISGTTSGVAAGNLQTPFQIAWAAQSSLVSTTLGRIMAEYLVELTEPVDPMINL
ncbi:MAG: capsid protein P3 [Sobemovirus sp.]|nr:MAG: capsid protein P3 [Sobemovirus sp.]